MYFDRLDPAKTLFVGTNGTHGICNIVMDPLQAPFFERFVKGVNNGFETTPHVVLGHELAGGEGVFGIGSKPAWVSSVTSVRPQTLYLHADGRMDATSPSVPETPLSYSYPLPSSSLGVE